MDFNAFKTEILSLDGLEIIEFIQENRNSVKLLFINAQHDLETQSDMKQILRYLTQLQLDATLKTTEQIQFLYLELGLYFKTVNNEAFVSTCFNKIGTNVLKYRLRAWTSYRQYSAPESHIKRLPNYLRTLSLAIRDEEMSYENEVIRDLHNYILDAQHAIRSAGKEELIENFLEAINSNELADQFPILSHYHENKEQFDLDTEITPHINKVFEPSIFSQNLFDDKFTRYIKEHPDTRWYEILLGIPQNQVREKIIGKGQTNFDKEVAGLVGLDIVKLYAHCNMRMHFFSSIYLFERLEAFFTLYNSPGSIKFIDIGCGPATAGLSFIEHIYGITGGEVSFDYIGVDYYQNMLDGAAYFLDNPVFRPEREPVFIKNLSDLDFEDLNDANSILINTSYLFASDSLDPEKLAANVMNVRRAQPTVPCYLLFQNSVLDENNIKYKVFKKAIGNHTSLHRGTPTIHYVTQRGRLNHSSIPVYLEILLLN